MKTLLIETLLVFITFILGGILYTLDNVESVPKKIQTHIDKRCKGAKKYINTGKRHNDGPVCILLFSRYPTAFIVDSESIVDSEEIKYR